MSNDALVQRQYYERTAHRYDEMHIAEGDEHFLALSLLSAMIDHFQLKSVLDIGSGTGRTLLYLKEKHDLRIMGVEPVAQLREQGYAKGLTQNELIDGNALELNFPDDEFEMVCEFAMLHHVKDHRKAISEMCRVAKFGVFISDANNFGQGGPGRYLKQILNAFGLWSVLDYLRTGGKGYHLSEGDGLFYSYSVFSDLSIVRSKFPKLHYFNTMPSGPNLYRSAPHLAVLGRR